MQTYIGGKKWAINLLFLSAKVFEPRLRLLLKQICHLHER